MFRLTFDSVSRVKRGHQHVIAQTDRAIEEALTFAGRFAQDHVRKYPGFKPQSGALQSATKTRIVRTSGGKLVRISNAKKYASAIDGGARPHVIVPKRGKFLRFRGRGGNMVFARRVNHPGNRPYKFLYRATNAAGRVMERNLSQRLSAIASRF